MRLGVSTVVGGKDDMVVDDEAVGKCAAGVAGGCSVGAVGVVGAANGGVVCAVAIGVGGGVLPPTTAVV